MSTLGYNGNPRLRKAFTQVAMSQHELNEFKKCVADPVYFTREYMKIVALGKGIVPFDLYDFQEEMINTFQAKRFVICKIPRQSGKSITTIAYLLHTILFNENYNIAILAHKGAAANGLLGRLKLAYENLPTWLQQGIIEWNKGNIELENGSKIGAFATSADGLRSGSYDIILLDEFAFVPNNIAEEFFTSTYPVITAGDKTKIIIVSTPKGMNHFYTMWIKAEQGKSDYYPISVHWSAVPGRDERWKEETIRNTSEEQFSQEFNTDFLGSSNTLISASKIQQLMLSLEEPLAVDGRMKYFEKPQKKRVYTLVVDVSEGLGLDYSTFSVIDVTEIPYKVVATYRDNDVKPIFFPTLIVSEAKKYNEAFILVEINSIGLQVADIIHYDLAYENLVKIQLKGKQGQQWTQGFTKKVAFGLKTSPQTKQIGCTNLKALIESDKIIIKDEAIIKELTTFAVDKRSFKAEEGSHDDLVMTLVNFSWLMAQKFFRETVKNDARFVIEQEQAELLDREFVPFGFIDDGLNDEHNLERDRDGDLWHREREELYPFDDMSWFHGEGNNWGGRL
jgi:hypothetical protein